MKVVGEIVIAFGQLEHVLWVAGKRTRRLTIKEWIKLAEGGKNPFLKGVGFSKLNS